MFVPHTEDQRKEMLQAIGVKNFDELLGGLPPSLLRPALDLPDTGWGHDHTSMSTALWAGMVASSAGHG